MKVLPCSHAIGDQCTSLKGPQENDGRILERSAKAPLEQNALSRERWFTGFVLSFEAGLQQIVYCEWRLAFRERQRVDAFFDC